MNSVERNRVNILAKVASFVEAAASQYFPKRAADHLHRAGTVHEISWASNLCYQRFAKNTKERCRYYLRRQWMIWLILGNRNLSNEFYPQPSVDEHRKFCCDGCRRTLSLPVRFWTYSWGFFLFHSELEHKFYDRELFVPLMPHNTKRQKITKEILDMLIEASDLTLGWMNNPYKQYREIRGIMEPEEWNRIFREKKKRRALKELKRKKWLTARHEGNRIMYELRGHGGQVLSLYFLSRGVEKCRVKT